VTEGPHRGQQFRFTGHETFLVGRSPLAHFQLSDKDRYFSRIHFMIEVNLPYCRLVDAGSRNGTYVNGRRVCSVDLHDSDHIRAGYTVLHVSLPTVAPHRKTSTAVPGTAPPPGTALFSPPGTLPWVPDAPDTSLPVVPGFEIVRPLGRGGMGTVYEAIHQADGSRVALKTIVPAVVENPSAVTRFLREAGILRELDHPHIVRFLDIGEANEVLFFAMEYVSGTDAARLLLQRGPLPLPTAIALTCQVLEALAYAHDRGFVHRDVKPANILIAECAGQSHVKLADFGLARVYQTSQLSGLTLSGAVGGTFGFMSPEQARSVRSARPQSDQYATAASLYNLLTGHFLYDFNQFEAFPLAVILTEDPVPIDRRRSDLPAGLVEAIHRATARDPADRFPDVQAFREALLPFAS
jgi:serine/threonine-protein kinase